jgi:hypothetical protein
VREAVQWGPPARGGTTCARGEVATWAERPTLGPAALQILFLFLIYVFFSFFFVLNPNLNSFIVVNLYSSITYNSRLSI